MKNDKLTPDIEEISKKFDSFLKKSQESLDTLLARQKIINRSELADYAKKRVDEFNSSLKIQREEFMISTAKQLNNLEKYNDDKLYIQHKKQIEEQIKTFFNKSEDLLNEFIESLKSTLK